jgi:hypothetical protein
MEHNRQALASPLGRRRWNRGRGNRAMRELNMQRTAALWLGLLLLPALCFGQSAFDGTWRPDPQRPSHPKTEIAQLANGQYECPSCTPPYTAKADGHDQPIQGNLYFDTISITIVDDRTISKIGKKDGRVVADTKVTVAADGATKTEVQTIIGMAPVPVELTSVFSRISSGKPGSHPISGGWQMREMDVSNHVEDTSFKLSGGALAMIDRMGRSFTAKLDGTPAPYKGSDEFNSVSLKLIDERTIEESDLNDGKVVKISRWSLSPDGQTMHARFDDLHGHIQEQDGHKVK